MGVENLEDSKAQAIGCYSIAITQFEKKCGDLSALNDELMTLLTQIYTNRALVYFSVGNIENCLKDVNFVLNKIDSKNFKALYRRALCYKHQSELSKATEDLNSCLLLNPENAQVKHELDGLKDKLGSSD